MQVTFIQNGLEGPNDNTSISMCVVYSLQKFSVCPQCRHKHPQLLSLNGVVLLSPRSRFRFQPIVAAIFQVETISEKPVCGRSGVFR